MFIKIDDGKNQILVSVSEISKIISRGKHATLTLNDGTSEHFTFETDEEAYEFVSQAHRKLKVLNLA